MGTPRSSFIAGTERPRCSATTISAVPRTSTPGSRMSSSPARSGRLPTPHRDVVSRDQRQPAWRYQAQWVQAEDQAQVARPQLHREPVAEGQGGRSHLSPDQGCGQASALPMDAANGSSVTAGPRAAHGGKPDLGAVSPSGGKPTRGENDLPTAGSLWGTYGGVAKKLSA